jgi:hypothetical protein
VIPETDAGPGEDETVVEGDSTSGDDVCGGTNTPAPVGDQTDGESPANLDLSVGYDDADGTDDLANELPAGDSAPASETAVPETTEVVDDVPVGTVAESDNDRIFGGAGSDWIFGQAGDDILFGDDLDDVLTTDFLADLLLGAVSIA